MKPAVCEACVKTSVLAQRATLPSRVGLGIAVEGGGATAYVRKKKSRGGVYYQVVESRRVDGNPRQKVLVHLGHHETVDAALCEWPREIETLRRFASRGAEESASWNFETFRSWSRETERRAESARRRADDLESNLERLRELRRRDVV